jgi:CRP-like cAMP-binding protein
MIWKIQQQKQDNIIKNIPLFTELSDDATAAIERIIVKKKFHKDQIVLFEEETASYMYIVYSGKVRVVKLNEDGREQIITIRKKNDYFGEMALLDGKTSPATVIAHEDAVIGLLSKDDFDRHIFSNPAIRSNIIKLLCNQLRDSWAMIKVLSFDNAEHRVMAVLDRMGSMYGIKDERGTIINIKLTHQQIASYASVARETATRVLNRLGKDSAIQTLDNRNILLTETFRAKFREVM